MYEIDIDQANGILGSLMMCIKLCMPMAAAEQGLIGTRTSWISLTGLGAWCSGLLSGHPPTAYRLVQPSQYAVLNMEWAGGCWCKGLVLQLVIGCSNRDGGMHSENCEQTSRWDM